nr:P5 protein [papaya virus E]
MCLEVRCVESNIHTDMSFVIFCCLFLLPWIARILVYVLSQCITMP